MRFWITDVGASWEALVHALKSEVLNEKELAKKIGRVECYLINELAKEKRTIDEKSYETLCKISKENFENLWIIKRNL